MGKKILAVDDSASVLQMVSSILTEAGYEVIKAIDGKDGLEKASQSAANMVITDLNMPNMDGIQMIRELRKMPQYKFVPIILLTVESQFEKKQQGKEAGATGWIIKPFKPEQLLGIVKKVLK